MDRQPEQLEFSLWTEVRLSAWDMTRSDIWRDFARWAAKRGPGSAYYDPLTGDTIVRYRV